ncbi:MAG: SUMF1/EgtB/PvdO family nonheme iron enzyme [Planctomycetes bacterium]|nr:SUMF1/EgtB/PvdO family nonheme iron enzyme [Planctomycetota bacterium]MCB9891712.1 SUMF1/EgtB/PvdO family nonheme iron enzyme [Planctomycetota bacterium]MCB9918731.1 SUMF1/EgtB/PvdO family nonheme iron enzyme [Planctomycetota bacterium]
MVEGPPLPDPLLPEEIEAAVIAAVDMQDAGEIERLLAAHPGHADEIRDMVAAAGGPDLGREAGPLADAFEHREEVRIGPYRLLSKLGEGGMGEVWIAEQLTPVSRRVAIKFVREGLDSAAILKRFERERQALALMSHPAIASIFDAGQTADGRPYFVMEYVDGIPLVRFCDRESLDIDTRIRIFCQVCQAVQHAHQKGVMHRDIKPANILVYRDSGGFGPKLIDFGLARSSLPFVSSDFVTLPGNLLGTPEYMSPEQLSGGEKNVDTRSDIYGLGIVLYELLTGALPYDISELRDGGIAKIQRVIVEDECPLPSARVMATADSRDSYILPCGLEAPALARRLRGELDWIVLRALEKQPSRRYASAADLQRDLENHLSNGPVLAARPTTWYRLQKIGRRHGGALLLGFGLLAALVIGLVLSQQNATRARESEARTKTALAALENERFPVLLRSLIEGEQELWPARPELIPLLEAWLDKSVALREQADEHRRALEELRATADLTTDRARRIATDLANVREQLIEQRIRYEKLRTTPGERYLTLRGRLRLELDASYREIEKRESLAMAGEVFTFASFEDTLRHREATRIVMLLDDFDEPDRGIVARIRERLALAERVRRHLSEDAPLWMDVKTRLGTRSGFSAFSGKPVAGLVPLGPDPTSRLEEFAAIETGLPPQRIDGKLTLLEQNAAVFVLVPAATFAPGAVRDATSPRFDPDASPDEAPITPVELDAFFLSKYELTQAQWERMTGLTPSYYRERSGEENDAQRPVESMSALEAERLLARRGMSLPSEAQWEYACRARTDGPWGFEPATQDLASYAHVVLEPVEGLDMSPWQLRERADLLESRMPRPVGTLLPNGFGFHDMHGNVAEWTRDPYLEYGSARNRGDGAFALTTADRMLSREAEDVLRRVRVLRGGSFSMLPKFARSASRVQLAGEVASGIVGVRPIFSTSLTSPNSLEAGQGRGHSSEEPK